MSAAPRNTIDIKGATPIADSQERVISPNDKRVSQESLQSILAELEEPGPIINTKPKIQILPETDANTNEAYQKLIDSFSRNHCYSSVVEDSRGENDVVRKALYQEALESMLQDFCISLNLPESQKDLPINRNLTWQDQIRLSMPRANFMSLLTAIEAVDINKDDFVSAVSSTKLALKSFFEKTKTWIEAKPTEELTTIKEKLENFLAVLDSISTIVRRSPLKYPNRDILNQESHVPAYATKEKPAKWPNKSKPKPQTSWKDVHNMFAQVESSTQPINTASTTDSEDNKTYEVENWELHTSLAIRDYEKLCEALSITQNAKVVQKLNNLNNDWIGKSKKIKDLDSITDLLQQQIYEAQSKTNVNSDQLFEAKVALRSMIEQFHTLKNLSVRNLSGANKFVAKARIWGSGIYRSFQRWLKPKENIAKDLKSPTITRPKSKRSFWWAFGFASITGLFSGEPQQKATTQSENDTTATVDNHSSSQPQVTTTPQVSAINKTNVVTESSNPESTVRQASIQKRLQDTLKSPDASSIFRSLYSQLPTDLSTKQQTYLANTFAHVLRPHLGFHSNLDSGPLQITYLGSAPHHKHTFRISSGSHTEEVRVHIPLWDNIARGLSHADAPISQHNQQSAPVYTGPSDTETELASTVPPPPPGGNSVNVHNAVEIDNALDALSQADQLPPTPSDAPVSINPTKRMPSRAAIALEELAQSDRNKNRSA